MSSSTNTDCHHQHQSTNNTSPLIGGTTIENNATPCACSNISIMQLFHELKAKFPAVPDHIVSQHINKYYHDREACISLLSQEQARLPRGVPYPPDLMGVHRNSLETLPSNICPTNPTQHKSCNNHNNNNNSVNLMLVNTKEKLNKITNDGKRNSKFYLDEDQFYKNESSGKNFMKKSLNKVGKFAERISKKCDFSTRTDNNKRNRLVRQRNIQSDDEHIIENSKNLDSGFMDDTSLTNSKLYKRDKTKSQSLECLLSSQTSTEMSTSLQNLARLQLDSGVEKPSPLAKSCRITNFHNKPPIPVKPKVKDTEDTHTPKRPTTLIDPTTTVKTKIPFTLPPSELNCGTPTSVNVLLNVNVDVVQSPNQNQRTVLNMNPELGWLTPQSPRSYTSVNLTLRTPTSEPQSPIDIQTSNAGLTYSSSSFDPRKGFQSSVQITVAPAAAGGTVSALRMRPRSSYIPETNNLLSPISDQSVSQRAGSLPDLATSISLLIKRQLEKKERLRMELIAEKRKLTLMQQEVLTLKALPKHINTSAQLIEETRLRREIRHFQAQCERLADEVDRRSYSRAPLGETNEEFYQNIYTGQRLQLQQFLTAQESIEGPPWTCHMCTFSNHPLLNNCEECGMIKCVRRGTSDSTITTDASLLDKHFLNPPPSSQIVFKNNNLTDFINNNSAQA